MRNVRYGMNLRYANIGICRCASWPRAIWWPCLPASAEPIFGSLFPSWRCCAFDLRQYQILFVKFGLYELVPEGLLRALQILK